MRVGVPEELGGDFLCQRNRDSSRPPGTSPSSTGESPRRRQARRGEWHPEPDAVTACRSPTGRGSPQPADLLRSADPHDTSPTTHSAQPDREKVAFGIHAREPRRGMHRIVYVRSNMDEPGKIVDGIDACRGAIDGRDRPRYRHNVERIALLTRFVHKYSNAQRNNEQPTLSTPAENCTFVAVETCTLYGWVAAARR